MAITLLALVVSLRPAKGAEGLHGIQAYTANFCRFLRSARNDARRLPMALLSHAGGLKGDYYRSRVTQTRAAG